MSNVDAKDLSKIAGPDSMAAPRRPELNIPSGGMSYANAAGSAGPSQPNQGSRAGEPQELIDTTVPPAKKKRHRAGKKRRNRRQSFIAPSETATELDPTEERPSLAEASRPSATQTSFYRLKSAARSNTSMESEALLDHRDHQPIRPRRQSIQQGMLNPRGSMPFGARQATHRPSHVSAQPSSPNKTRGMRSKHAVVEDNDEEEPTDRTPLMYRDRPAISRNTSNRAHRRSSAASPVSMGGTGAHRHDHLDTDDEDFDVNNPPSVPGSPKLGSLDDVMIAEEFSNGRSPLQRDAIINIDRDNSPARSFSPKSSTPAGDRRRTVRDLAENDVCYPGDVEESEMGEDEYTPRAGSTGRRSPRRRRHRQWPDLDVLDEWSREEKEERNQEHIRAKKISEPVMVGGRLRPTKTAWHREEDDAPYRYTYFSEYLDGTIHSRTISELCQFGASFKELFVPDLPELSDESESDEDDGDNASTHPALAVPESVAGSQVRSPSADDTKNGPASESATPAQSHTPRQREKRYGPRPTFWLDVLSPTETEMKVLAKAFGIHQLTTEDILMQEPREKVELFQSYYFVNYRSFEQDKDSEEYMEPVNMYVVVFKEAVISFHFSMTPHPANVRRRIRQLNDYMSPTADWISYAVIDDVTDVYAPLVQQIEDEVDQIDDAILALHSSHEDEKPKKSPKNKEQDEKSNKNSDTRSEKGEPSENGGDMLRRVGECRKKVMSLYRLLGNKADVIKGFAKRCNEHWEVAPRSEIGLYLGDIQDHIITMTGNLSHYENLLSRAHSNYLAQINIRMNERAEETNDVLGKLTILGTIVLPMNIVTGMWGMNVLVPGQDGDTLTWFWCITGGLFAFGLTCYFIAKRIYRLV